MRSYYQVKIDETCKNGTFNKVKECCSTMEDVIIFLKNRYGKIPRGKSKVFMDDKDGKPVQIGFTHSFWNRDISHNSKNWRQTDWIVVSHINETYVTRDMIGK